jgi:dihydrofolate synthase / folylpolyglutamate synthase
MILNLRKGEEYISSLEEWKGERNFSLHKISIVLKELGNPQDTVKAIHVGGTNGKGSVTAGISSILKQSGLKTGATISPHLSRVNERIIIDGKYIDNSLLYNHAATLKEVTEKLSVRLSLHEGITTLAFMVFSALKLDWMVLEVGLGGRLDSTNIIKRSEVSVIVSIDYDHMDVLGDTLEEIAYEKAGIVKDNSTLVLGDVPANPFEVITSVCRNKGSVVKALNRNYFVRTQALDKQDQKLPADMYTSDGRLFQFTTSLRGNHQEKNMAVAIEVCANLGIDTKSCIQGVRRIAWPGRIETIIKDGVKITLDCAHNPSGVLELVNFIKEEQIQGERLKLPIVFGALQSKNWHEMLEIMLPIASKFILLNPISTRAVPQDEVVLFLKNTGKEYVEYGESYDGLTQDLLNCKYGDQLLITGSMYMVGRVRGLLMSNHDVKELW